MVSLHVFSFTKISDSKLVFDFLDVGIKKMKYKERQNKKKSMMFGKIYDCVTNREECNKQRRKGKVCYKVMLAIHLLV